MSTLNVTLTDEDMEFLRAVAERSGASPEEFVARQASLMRERYLRPLHPDVKALSGIISYDGDARTDYLEHQMRKHS